MKVALTRFIAESKKSEDKIKVYGQYIKIISFKMYCPGRLVALAKKIAITPSELEEAVHWAESHRGDIPDVVYRAIVLLASIRLQLEEAQSKASNLLYLFRQKLGVIPSSEQGKAPKTPKPKLNSDEKLKFAKERLKKLSKEIRRYEDMLGISKKTRRKRQKEKELAKANGTIEPEFIPSEESLFIGKLGDQVYEKLPLKVDRMTQFDYPTGLHTSADERQRSEFTVSTKTLNLSVETVTDLRTGKSVTASTDHIGPPNSQVTWVGVANAVIAVVSYAIPINRLATMLTQLNPYFTSSRITEMLKLAATMFEAIYIELGKQLANADILMGDDTSGKVLEINKQLADGEELVEAPEDSMIGRVAKVFGRIFEKKRGVGHKRKLNVSVVIGKTVARDSRSFIFFFRAHLGSFGDLVSKILENREKKHKPVTIVSDLATTNLLTPSLYKTLDIKHVGCGAHARRPFWRHKDLDQDLCFWFLTAFLILENIEDRIDRAGRTRENIEYYRGRFGKKVWRLILERSVTIVKTESFKGKRWPKTSQIYNACEYIVNHYEKLTAYLDDARLPSTNNQSERVLRWDKIMEDASKFRKTEEGRLRIDILRTIVHTCSAAKVDLKDYLIFVFKNQDQVNKNPQSFTPYQFALAQAKINKSPK